MKFSKFSVFEKNGKKLNEMKILNPKSETLKLFITYLGFRN